jgi:hypothetical protein
MIVYVSTLVLTVGSPSSPSIPCFPLTQWCPPEVCVAMAAEAARGKDDPPVPVPAKTTSDVYMVGGLAYELLTGGTIPFHWLSGNPQILIARRASAGPVRVPGIPVPLPGLLGKSVFEAAEVDGEAVPWCVQADATPGSAGRLEELKEVVGTCLAREPEVRPKLPALLATIEGLLEGEVGSTGGGGGPTPLSGGAGGGTASSTLSVPVELPSILPTGQLSLAGVWGGG